MQAPFVPSWEKGGYPYSVRWQDSISTPWIWQRSICGITAFRLNKAVHQLINPYKIYYILQEICCTGDKYDDEFETKFGAQRIYEPKTTPYDTASLENIYQAVQISCKECLDAVKYFEPSRKYGYIWNIIDTTLMKFMYFAQPQGQLLNDMQKAIREMDREDIPLPEITAQGKAVIEKLQKMTQEELAEDLYFVETFIPNKRRSNLQNIQENFEDSYKKISGYMESGDYMTACVMMLYKFYEMYYYNNLQEDVNKWLCFCKRVPPNRGMRLLLYSIKRWKRSWRMNSTKRRRKRKAPST